MISEEVIQLIHKKASEIMEHVDSVRIFVTYHQGEIDSTQAYNYGGGNFYAQRGQITEWLEYQKQSERNQSIATVQIKE